MKIFIGLTLGAFLAVTSAPAITPASAQEEKLLNIYNWSDYRAPGTFEQFQAETGIKVVEANYDSNEALEKRLLAGSSGFDIVVPSGFFLQRQIGLGLYRKLDKAKLPNLVNMDPAIMRATQAFDPGNSYAVDYMWGTTALGYNVDAVAERLPNAPADSWDLLFKPQNAARLADCGITVLDAPAEVMAIALNYLGLDPNSENEDDLVKAEELMNTIRPYIRKFDSSAYIDDLANGDVCLSIGYSGDVYIARARAESAGNGIEVQYVVPSEGTIQWFDMLAIPKDAPHPENALKFINFVMEPQVIADISNYVFYANGNKAAFPLVDEAIRNDPNIYPPPEVAAKLVPLQAHSESFSHTLARAWARIKTGS